jgi:hypothetical protein
MLLFADNIEALTNLPTGTELHWRCTCGQTGVSSFARSGLSPATIRTLGSTPGD